MCVGRAASLFLCNQLIGSDGCARQGELFDGGLDPAVIGREMGDLFGGAVSPADLASVEGTHGSDDFFIANEGENNIAVITALWSTQVVEDVCIYAIGVVKTQAAVPGLAFLLTQCQTRYLHASI
jgi:hypothetical protein